MSKNHIHTTEQPDSDVTAFFLSCDRLNLLSQTMQSFLDTVNEKTKMVIMDDSGNKDVFEKLKEQYGESCDIVCFPENRSQWYCLDFMPSYCYTRYIMYIEDDWKFLKSGYMQLSKTILESNREIGIIDISDRRFEEYGSLGESTELFIWKKPWRLSPQHLYWIGWCGSPNLKRREDLIYLGRIEKDYAEWQIDRKFYLMGLKSVYLKDRYCTHIGDDDSKMNGKRPNDQLTPEMQYPLKHKSKIQAIDWYFMEKEPVVKVDTGIYGPS